MRRFALLLSLLLLPLPAGAGQLSLAGIPLGMKQVRGDLWVDRAATPEQVGAIAKRTAAAATGTARAFGKLGAKPVWQVCVSAGCDRINGMTSRAMTLGWQVITVSSRAAADPKTYLHERVHAELHRAEGFAGRQKNLLPNWFDEGMATVLSRSVGFPAKRAECRAFEGAPLPRTRAEFTRLSKAGGKGAGPVYKASACRVLVWLDHGHSPADALRLLAAGRRLP